MAIDRRSAKALAQWCNELVRAWVERNEPNPEPLSAILAEKPIELALDDARGFVADDTVIAPLPLDMAEAARAGGMRALVLSERLTPASTRELLARWRLPDPGATIAEADLPGVRPVLARLTISLPVPDPGQPLMLDPVFEICTAAEISRWQTPDEARAGRANWGHVLDGLEPLATVVRSAAVWGADEDLCGAVTAMAWQLISIEQPEALVKALTSLSDYDASLAAPLEEAIESALASDAQLDLLVDMLERPEHRTAASTLLHMLGRVEPKALLERVVRARSPEGRAALAGVLRERSIEPSDLMDAADPYDAGVFGFMALVACRGKNDVAWPVIRKRGLEHFEPAVRAATLSAFTRMDARQFGREIDKLIADSAPNVRRIARDLVVRRGDPGPGPALASLLQRSDLEAPERKSIITALGAVGGPEPQKALMGGVKSESEVELKVACALALGNIADAEGEAFLREQLERTLIRRAVKDACEMGLERCKLRSETKTQKSDNLTKISSAVGQGTTAVADAAKQLLDEDPSAMQEAVLDLGIVLEQRDLTRTSFKAVVAGLVVLRCELAAEILRTSYRRIRDPELRVILVWALGRMGDPGTVSFLQAEMRRRSLPGDLRQAIRQALEANERPSTPDIDLSAYLHGLTNKESYAFLASAATDALKTSAKAMKEALEASGMALRGTEDDEPAHDETPIPEPAEPTSIPEHDAIAASRIVPATSAARPDAHATDPDDSLVNELPVPAQAPKKHRPTAAERTEAKRQRLLERAKKELAVAKVAREDADAAAKKKKAAAAAAAEPQYKSFGPGGAPQRPAEAASETTPPPRAEAPPDIATTDEPESKPKPRKRAAPDFGHMFANYVCFETDGRHVFGCRYGTDELVDVHHYGGTEEEAYQLFFKDKIAAGFVPRTNRQKLGVRDLFHSLDETLLNKIYASLMGVPS